MLALAAAVVEANAPSWSKSREFACVLASGCLRNMALLLVPSLVSQFVVGANAHGQVDRPPHGKLTADTSLA